MAVEVNSANAAAIGAIDIFIMFSVASGCRQIWRAVMQMVNFRGEYVWIAPCGQCGTMLGCSA
jgi:hypothetical protein